MRNSPPTSSSPQSVSTDAALCRNSAFTLVEILVVLGILLVLSTLITPAVNSLLRGSTLSQAAQMIQGEISQARQAALGRNRSIEIRFYKFADPEAPSQGSNPAARSYRAFQLFEVKEDGRLAADGKLQRLPGNVIIDRNPRLSSLLGRPERTPSAAERIPRSGTDYSFVAFRFLPDGSTDLPPGEKWFVTLHNNLDGDDRTAPPPNFYTAQIDPINGRLKQYRP